MADTRVDWRTEQVTALFVGASMKVLSELAFTGAGDTVVNIRNNDQVDTGFMLNSVYAVTPYQSSYPETWASGEYESRSDKNAVPRRRAPNATRSNYYTCIIAVAAEYAIYQEMKKPFLFPAIEGLAAKHAGIVEKHKVG